jgi:predicted methyltransferase
LAEPRRIVREVAAAVGLAEGERGVDAVISALARLEPVSIRRVSRATELPVPIVASICGELRKRAVVAEERPAQLTSSGRALFAAGELALPARATCSGCNGHGLVIPRGLAPVVREVAQAARAAPPPRLELDQCHCTVETKIRRVLALHEAGALVGRRLLVLGDDDLVALTIDRVVRRFGTSSSIAHLAVLDVDPRVAKFARSALAGAPYPWTTVVHDLREPLPEELRGAFDTVVTDPPYTVAGARLFLSRATEALASAGDVFFSFGSRRPGAAYGIQRAVADAGLVIRSLVRDFNEYVGAGVLGGTSHLYHLSATPDLRPLPAVEREDALYTAG